MAIKTFLDSVLDVITLRSQHAHENKRIVIEAVNTAPRKNWFAYYNIDQNASVIGEIEETTIEQECWEC